MKANQYLKILGILLLSIPASHAAEEAAELTREEIKKLPPQERLAYVVSMFSGKKVAPGKDLRMPDAVSIVKRFDADGSGGLSQGEFPKMPDPKKFAKLDRDKSGELDRAEVEQLVKFLNRAIEKQNR
jgi:hypothetical protein